MAKLYSTGYSIGGTGIAKNNLEVKTGDLLAIKSWFVDKAVVGDKVVGISTTTKTYKADNETVFQDKVEFVELADKTLVEVEVVGWTLDQSKIGTVFNLNSDNKVDWVSSGTGEQLRLMKIKSEKIGIFQRP